MRALILTAGAVLALSLALPVHAATPAAAPPAEPPVAGVPADLAPGTALFDAGRFEESLAFFRAYSESHPKSAVAAFYTGRSLIGLERYKEAVSWIEKAVALDPDNSDLHRWLARIYGRNAILAGSSVAKNRFAQEAKDQLDKAVRLDPNNVRVHEDLADFYVHSPEFLGGSVDRARQEAAEVLKRDRVSGHIVLANIALALKQPDQAEHEYETAIQETPADMRPRLALGFYYQSQGRWDEAFDTFEGMLKVDPERWDAIYQIGKTGALSGRRLDRAEECLKRYVGHTPSGDEPVLGGAHFRLGMVYLKKGDLEAARREYQEAVKLSPDLEDARKALASLPPAAPPAPAVTPAPAQKPPR